MDLYEYDEEAIRELLLGRTVTKVASDKLILDDGRILTLTGHVGGCCCGAGDYDLMVLNGFPINAIMDVEFVADPHSYYDDGEGVYRIFVLAQDERILLAEFQGSDGNGYYGTGFHILVDQPMVD